MGLVLKGQIVCYCRMKRFGQNIWPNFLASFSTVVACSIIHAKIYIHMHRPFRANLRGLRWYDLLLKLVSYASNISLCSFVPLGTCMSTIKMARPRLHSSIELSRRCLPGSGHQCPYSRSPGTSHRCPEDPGISWPDPAGRSRTG